MRCLVQMLPAEARWTPSISIFIKDLVEMQVPDELGSETAIQLVNPAGLQLVTQTHFMRAADRRFGEPEDLMAESLEYCR